MIIIYGFQPLTVITKCSTLDVTAVLDPPVIKSNPGSCRLLSSQQIFELRKSQRGIKCQLCCLKYNLVKVLIFGSCVQEYYLDSSDKLKDFDPAFF